MRHASIEKLNKIRNKGAVVAVAGTMAVVAAGERLMDAPSASASSGVVAAATHETGKIHTPGEVILTTDQRLSGILHEIDELRAKGTPNVWADKFIGTDTSGRTTERIQYVVSAARQQNGNTVYDRFVAYRDAKAKVPQKAYILLGEPYPRYQQGEKFNPMTSLDRSNNAYYLNLPNGSQFKIAKSGKHPVTVASLVSFEGPKDLPIGVVGSRIDRFLNTATQILGAVKK